MEVQPERNGGKEVEAEEAEVEVQVQQEKVEVLHAMIMLVNHITNKKVEVQLKFHLQIKWELTAIKF